MFPDSDDADGAHKDNSCKKSNSSVFSDNSESLDDLNIPRDSTGNITTGAVILCYNCRFVDC